MDRGARRPRACRRNGPPARACPRRTPWPTTLRAGPGITDEVLVNKGTAVTPRPEGAKALAATYFWPMQSHASIGPSCAVADVSADGATVWTASQGTHGNRNTFARFLGLPREKVRLIYLEGSGCYGMNGHEDAAADAAILSRAVGRPVRVQWSREDEHGWDPKGPPQLHRHLRRGRSPTAASSTGAPRCGFRRRRKGLPNIPLLAPEAAGLEHVRGLNAGLISQNGDPPYAADSIQVVAHWLKDAPLRPAPIRSPGKPANCFAVESFVDELAAAARLDPLEFRLRWLKDPRGIEVIRRMAAADAMATAALPWSRQECRRRARTRHGLRPLQAQRDLCGDGHGRGGRASKRPDQGRARGLRARLRPDHQPRRRARPGRGQHPADAEPRADGGGEVRSFARHQHRLVELSDPDVLATCPSSTSS